MKKTFAIFFILLGVSYNANAANWYVRPSGGSGAGTSWTAAWNNLSGINWASVSAGDTIWVAGGTYTGDISTGKSGTAVNRISVRRARSDSSECTGASGWSSGYDSLITQNQASIIFNSYNYITVSGATTAAGGSQGWKITYSGATSGVGIEWPNGSTGSYNRVEWMEIEGPGYITYTNDGRGIDATPFSSATNNTFSNCKIHDWESTVYLGGFNYATFEYCEFYGVDAVNSLAFHPNMIYLTDADYFTFRYNYVHGKIGEGIFWTNNDDNVTGAYIYGNVFANTLDGGSTTKVLQPDNIGTMTDLHVFNNVFDNNYNVFSGDSAYSSCESRNNIYTRNGTSDPLNGAAGWTHSNNLVSNSGTGIFVNLGTDYHITATIGTGYARDAGTNLSSQFTTDKDGNTFGADGTWDIGAYEYGSGGSDTTPPTISNPLPSGAQAYVSNPQDVTLQVTTNETATCRMATIDISYLSMTDIFTNTSSTSHSETKSLTPGTTYTYYVRCSDAFNNANTSSTLIQFSIDSQTASQQTFKHGRMSGFVLK